MFTFKDGVVLAGAKIASDYIGSQYLSKSEKLQHQLHREELDYKKDYSASQLQLSRENADREYWARENERRTAEDIARQQSMDAIDQRIHEQKMQYFDSKERERDRAVERERIDAQRYIAELGANVALKNGELDREAAKEINERNIANQKYMLQKKMDNDLYMQDRSMEHDLTLQERKFAFDEKIENLRIQLQQNLAEKNESLQRYLTELGINASKELARFNALAIRETQILAARENAKNTLQDRLVQEALKTYPLNVSPLVLLKGRPLSLSSLLRFSVNKSDNTFLPDIADVYEELIDYSSKPEPFNIFIAPIHISSTIDEKEVLTKKIWDIIYQKVEKFFSQFYNRSGSNPVVLYPTAWKDETLAGQHASETLHFFLKDMPCLVIEPRVDGHDFGIVMSGWNNGYLSSEHIRTQTNFNVNIYSSLIDNAYNRSKASLKILEVLEGNMSSELEEEKKRLERNIRTYETLDINEDNLQDIERLGVDKLFDINYTHDFAEIADIIASVICINLAVMSDIHHLQATDTPPVFPRLFKVHFPNLFENKNLRETVSECYEQVLRYLRAQDILSVSREHRRELELIRELQIENINKELALITEEDQQRSVDRKLQEYLIEKTGEVSVAGEELWLYAVEHMTVDDIPFFQEILPNIQDRRTYKRIDKKIAELQR